MKRIGKKLLFAITMVFTLSMVAPGVVPITTATTVEAASVKLNYKKLTLYKGQKKQLKIKGTKKKAKWSSNKKSVVSVDKKGKITAKKKGNAIITAKVGKKRYKCKVTVKVKTVNNVDSNFLKLKSYILKYGQTNSKGNKFIKYTMDENNFAIVYDGKGFDFIFTQDNGETESSIDMYIKSPNKSKLYPEYIIIFEYYGESATASTSLDPATYKKNSNLEFYVTSSTGFINDYNIQDVANSGLRLAFVGWELLVHNYTGMKLPNLGFFSYK